jgi:ABC-type uncharacterized transport system permease subunit
MFLFIITAFIINHSKAYTIALLASMTEFWLEYLIFPKLKLNYAVAGTGLALMGAGQVRAARLKSKLIGLFLTPIRH